MAVLDHLDPRGVFFFFEQLCAIPHGSGNTRAISDWLVSFAQERGLEYHQDALNNVIIIQPATPGYEAAPAVILQGHMDMVCEQAADCAKNMDTDGLDLAVEGDAIFAKGTTLGGDDGIALAMALAVMDDPSIPHPRLEAVFTVDEEVGMDGAAGLDVSPLQGRRMLNIDSEDEGVFTVSCAGGNMSRSRIPVRREPWAGQIFTLVIDRLQGGHSGVEIDKGRANANMLLGRVLFALSQETELRLLSVAGGLKDNAIPVKASAALMVREPAAAEAVCARMAAAFREEYAVTDPAIALTLTSGGQGIPMDSDSTARVICMLTCMPNGIQAMSADIPGLVQTSLNLGILTTEEDRVEAVFCVRSSIESQKRMLVGRLQCLSRQLGGELITASDYPGWSYRQDSPLRELMTEVFREQYGREPKIEAIHAGVECGLFAGKLPGLDCVSFGPDLSEIHTPREKLYIGSTQRTWKLLLEVLRRMK